MRYIFLVSIISLILLAFSFRQNKQYDIIIRNGLIYDGSGSPSYKGDLAIQGDSIAAIGDLHNDSGKEEIDAKGMAVAPGFINMLSWADKDLLRDGKSMSDIKQGVTLEVFGEGWSPAPVKRKRANVDSLWTSLDGYFKWITKKGVTPNVASFVGGSSVRFYVLDNLNKKPTTAELAAMKNLVKQAMEDGAMGLGTSLIYVPALYASTEELIELSKVASSYGGMYITHMRSESDFIFQAMNETFRISREARIPVEIYHLKINHSRNWNKLDTVLTKIDSAQKAGLKISANMYTYTASGTGLNERIPKWVQEGGAKEMRKRLKNTTIRKKVLEEMRLGIPTKNSDPKDVMLLGFRLDSLNKLYRGKRLDEVAQLHGKDADETVLDLIIRDKSRIEAIYFLISEDNMRKMFQKPYVSFGSDAGSQTIPDNFKDVGAHPRTYGTFARLLGKYVRDEKLLPLEEAIRRLTSLPASHLKLKRRGALKVGYFADITIFDPSQIEDHATFEDPHQYATGMIHVFVNGIQVLKDGEHTGAKPGRAIRGPGYKKRL
ncbi:MAG TPA: D-aminoacylase [Cyclobacteriaceae bacterium]|jgi:N-acyl-D-amino-acid deacylase|nr:D-aminoacylase [Cyclobacteriaceae bacterium]